MNVSLSILLQQVKEVANPLLLLLIMGQQMGNLKDMSNHATVILHV